MKGLAPIAIAVAALAAVPLVVHSNVVLNFLIVALLIALAGQGWNILGGYGGQYSFGHAAFFGTGAYATAILQVHYGVNAWLGFGAGIAAGAAVGRDHRRLDLPRRAAQFLFRAGDARLRRSFAHSRQRRADHRRRRRPLDQARSCARNHFSSTAASRSISSFWRWSPSSLVIAHLIERSRFGTWLIAVRENEDAAMALGVDAFTVKLAAMVVSAAITAAAGCFYAQYFLFVDSGIAYGTWISIEALLTPIIGGVGTVLGPLVGALVARALGEGAKYVAGDAPGLDLMIYGAMLVLVIAFAPRGLVGAFNDMRQRLFGPTVKARTPAKEAAHG